MNKQFDLIIIGSSKQGNAALKSITDSRSNLNIAFISKSFSKASLQESANVEYFKNEVALVDYKNRLFGCYLNNGDRLYCTHLIIATGLKYAPFLVNNKIVPNTYNTAANIDKFAKDSQAVVLGSCDEDVKLATMVAKRYKYVYFCTESINTGISDGGMKKLAGIQNLVVLPNASITKFAVVDNALSTLELSNYSTLTCSAIFVKTETKPETGFVPNNIFIKDVDGYLLTGTNLESTLVPKCFAVGNCTKNRSKNMFINMCTTILNDF